MSDSAYAELEIGFHRWRVDSYSVELRFALPGAESGVDVAVEHGVRLDLAGLRALTVDPVGYGRLLTKLLFDDHPTLKQAFIGACSGATGSNADLRVRLFIGPSAADLHAVRWVTLRDPRLPDGPWLVTNERIVFSRYLSSLGYLSGQGWQSVRLRPRTDLTALVVIANPSNLADYQLAPIDVADERTRATEALADIRTNFLAERGKVTLTNLVAKIREGCDILYLLCHGSLVDHEPVLYLEDEEGKVVHAQGLELVERLGELRELPRLVVLVSCQSSGRGEATSGTDPGVFDRALGPQLAEIGIPAVLAIQGDISVETVHLFMPRFFAEFQRDGQVDRSMAVARGAVRERADSWMPILFMRLRTGRLWYKPGLKFERWSSLLERIERGECTAILGPGLHESLLGSRLEIARNWAKEFGFPLASQERDDLPQVAQYVAVVQKDLEYPPRALEAYLRKALQERYRDDLPPEIQDARDAPLLDVLAAVGKKRRDTNDADPHKVLAALKIPIYVTTSPGNLLTEALKAAGKEPRTELSRWNDKLESSNSVCDSEPSFRPDDHNPLIYHVFGHFAEPYSLVLTEDDFFDYLIGITRYHDLIPSIVKSALIDTTLLFLGFQLDDWTFRVLFRTLMNREGGLKRRGKPHVAVQLDPEDDRVVDPDRARSYLEEFFRDDEINVYWGSVEDFVQELLVEQEKKRQRETPEGRS